jgi:hypothetical protein
MSTKVWDIVSHTKKLTVTNLGQVLTGLIPNNIFFVVARLATTIFYSQSSVDQKSKAREKGKGDNP